MRTLDVATNFIAEYAGWADALRRAVDLIQQDISIGLRDDGIAFSSVYGRAKTLDSVRGKLLKKRYLKPARELTDQLGIRVVVLRGSEVDGAVWSIQRRQSVVRAHSVDKRSDLGLREFGYRSVHLICRIPRRIAAEAGLPVGAPTVFEVQVRSLLEHAWAEIEHGVVYKAGADLPESLRRRFASLAATIELMEGEFERLGVETLNLIEKEKSEVFASGFARRKLDVPRLVALLEVYRPRGAAFRKAGSAGSVANPALLSRFVDALRFCGISSTHEFAQKITSHDFKKMIARFARAELIDADEVSHLAICLLLIGGRNRLVLQAFFSDFESSPAIRRVLGEGVLGEG